MSFSSDDLHKRRIAWGLVIATFIRAGWNPPRPTDKIVGRIAEDMELFERQSKAFRNTPTNRHIASGEVLTRRQKEVLILLANGLDREEVAAILRIGLEAVKTHMKAARRNLEAKTTTHAVAIAIRRGLIE